MDAQAAARLGDEIAHGFGVAAMIGGAVAGALIGAAVVAAAVATGGVALAIMAGSIAAGGLSMYQVVKGLSAIFNLPEPATGTLIQGSFDVFINNRNAMRAGEDPSASCSGLPLSHPMWPFSVLIAEGSATVYINGKPAARLHSKMVCGAHIKNGSENTFIGGPTKSVAFVLDMESWIETGLEILGLGAMGAAAVLASMVGAATLGALVIVGAAVMGGMALLGNLGDRLGPGYRDLLQGVAGMALVGAGPKAARLGRSSAAALLDELRASGVKFSPDKIVAIGRDPNGKIIFLEIGDSKSGLQHIVNRHASEFAQVGIKEAEIPAVVIKAITEGRVVGHQGRGTERPIYEVVIKGQRQRFAVTVGNNGYVVGANPKGTSN